MRRELRMRDDEREIKNKLVEIAQHSDASVDVIAQWYSIGAAEMSKMTAVMMEDILKDLDLTQANGEYMIKEVCAILGVAETSDMTLASVLDAYVSKISKPKPLLVDPKNNGGNHNSDADADGGEASHNESGLSEGEDPLMSPDKGKRKSSRRPNRRPRSEDEDEEGGDDDEGGNSATGDQLSGTEAVSEVEEGGGLSDVDDAEIDMYICDPATAACKMALLLEMHGDDLKKIKGLSVHLYSPQSQAQCLFVPTDRGQRPPRKVRVVIRSVTFYFH